MNSKQKKHVQITGFTALERPGEERFEKTITLRRFHRDQHGAMSLVTLFTILMLAFLLGMILNVCSHADGKIRMQYSADAATYSSGIVMARGMNSLAFTNHLLCDMLALTAFLREGKNNDAEQIALQILDQWEQSAPGLATMPIENTQGLDSAVSSMVPLQRQMVTQFSAWAKSFSDAVLPTCEDILEQELIPNYQRALTSATGDMVQQAAVDISTRHGMREDGQVNKARGQMGAHIWRTDASTFGGSNSGSDSGNRGSQDQSTALPVVDAWEHAPDSMTHWSNFVPQALNELNFPIDPNIALTGIATSDPAKLLNQYLTKRVKNEELIGKEEKPIPAGLPPAEKKKRKDENLKRLVAKKVARQILNRLRDEAITRTGSNNFNFAAAPLDMQIKFSMDIIAAMRREEIDKQKDKTTLYPKLSVKEQEVWEGLAPADSRIRAFHHKGLDKSIGGKLSNIEKWYGQMNSLVSKSIELEEEYNWTIPYYGIALSQRKYLAETYLAQWNNEKLVGFDRFGPMSQFATLWRGFTRGELRALLRENWDRNLLHVIKTPEELFTQMEDHGNDLRPPLSFAWNAEKRNDFLEKQYMFYGTVFWKPSHVFFKQLFSSPMSGDRVTFAKGMLFLPVPRLIRGIEKCCEEKSGRYFGDELSYHLKTITEPDGVAREQTDYSWNLLNQNWHFKLIPTGSGSLKDILTQSPGEWHNDGKDARAYVPPNFGELTDQDLMNINNH